MAQMPDAARVACAPLQEFKREGPVRLRAIRISDLHLGTPGCQAKHVLDFLRCTESKQLYLVGDIVDGWQLRRRWYWRQAHNDVVQKVLRKARHGTRVVFIPGNHDEFVRHFLELSLGGIEICDEAVHLSATSNTRWRPRPAAAALRASSAATSIRPRSAISTVYCTAMMVIGWRA